MTFSSNLERLQKYKKIEVSKKPNKLEDAHNVEKIGIKGVQPTKIMGLVYIMNKAMVQYEKDKREGKTFQFNSGKNDDKSNQLNDVVEKNASSVNNRKAIAIVKCVVMDCEFVGGVEPEGKDHVLARISITNCYDHAILDEFVKPRKKVVDQKTHVSGIKHEHMKHAISFMDAQKK